MPLAEQDGWRQHPHARRVSFCWTVAGALLFVLTAVDVLEQEMSPQPLPQIFPSSQTCKARPAMEESVSLIASGPDTKLQLDSNDHVSPMSLSKGERRIGESAPFERVNAVENTKSMHHHQGAIKHAPTAATTEGMSHPAAAGTALREGDDDDDDDDNSRVRPSLEKGTPSDVVQRMSPTGDTTVPASPQAEANATQRRCACDFSSYLERVQDCENRLQQCRAQTAKASVPAQETLSPCPSSCTASRSATVVVDTPPANTISSRSKGTSVEVASLIKAYLMGIISVLIIQFYRGVRGGSGVPNNGSEISALLGCGDEKETSRDSAVTLATPMPTTATQDHETQTAAIEEQQAHVSMYALQQVDAEERHSRGIITDLCDEVVGDMKRVIDAMVTEDLWRKTLCTAIQEGASPYSTPNHKQKAPGTSTILYSLGQSSNMSSRTPQPHGAADCVSRLMLQQPDFSSILPLEDEQALGVSESMAPQPQQRLPQHLFRFAERLLEDLIAEREHHLFARTNALLSDSRAAWRFSSETKRLQLQLQAERDIRVGTVKEAQTKLQAEAEAHRLEMIQLSASHSSKAHELLMFWDHKCAEIQKEWNATSSALADVKRTLSETVMQRDELEREMQPLRTEVQRLSQFEAREIARCMRAVHTAVNTSSMDTRAVSVSTADDEEEPQPIEPSPQALSTSPPVQHLEDDNTREIREALLRETREMHRMRLEMQLQQLEQQHSAQQQQQVTVLALGGGAGTPVSRGVSPMLTKGGRDLPPRARSSKATHVYSRESSPALMTVEDAVRETHGFLYSGVSRARSSSRSSPSPLTGTLHPYQLPQDSKGRF